MKTNRGITNLLCKKTIYIRSFFSPHPSIVNTIQLFSLPFLPCKSIMKLILTSLFTPQSMMLNAKLGFYVLDEASKERKLIAEYHIIFKKVMEG